ncbi:hypothetical protein ACFQ1S_15075 [Kibdelosporangium lantanae]|uniref:Uncharacterized protein n=1 Tax=Kibdelosporangium lantanae TaxID=1497396 RepID=A0ABW3M8E4_9PSEU
MLVALAVCSLAAFVVALVNEKRPLPLGPLRDYLGAIGIVGFVLSVVATIAALGFFVTHEDDEGVHLHRPAKGHSLRPPGDTRYDPPIETFRDPPF